MELIKSLLPLITFLLGAMLTLYLSRYNDAKRLLIGNVEAICELSDSWYSQVLELWVISQSTQVDESERTQKIRAYYLGNLYVGKYKRLVEELRGVPSCELLIATAEEFLKALTEPRATFVGDYRCAKWVHLLHNGLTGGLLQCRNLESVFVFERKIAEWERARGVIEESPGALLPTESHLLTSEKHLLFRLSQLTQELHLEAARIGRNVNAENYNLIR